jgi:hypothetical protein
MVSAVAAKASPSGRKKEGGSSGTRVLYQTQRTLGRGVGRKIAPVARCGTLWRAMTKPSRRSTVRRSFRLPLSIGGKLPALTADVSRGGFQAELPQVFMPGSVIHGYFLVDDAEVHFRGKVEWAEAGNPQLSVYSRMGVCFDETPHGLEPLFQRAEAKPRRVVKRLI